MTAEIHDPLASLHYVTHHYRARCSCGYIGPDREDEDSSLADLSIHRRPAEPEAKGA